LPLISSRIVCDCVAVLGVRDQASVWVAARDSAKSRRGDHVLVTFVDRNAGNIFTPVAGASLLDERCRPVDRRALEADRAGMRRPDAERNALVWAAGGIRNRTDVITGVWALGNQTRAKDCENRDTIRQCSRGYKTVWDRNSAITGWIWHRPASESKSEDFAGETKPVRRTILHRCQPCSNAEMQSKVAQVRARHWRANLGLGGRRLRSRSNRGEPRMHRERIPGRR
jgi:hypothetical protein